MTLKTGLVACGLALFAPAVCAQTMTPSEGQGTSSAQTHAPSTIQGGRSDSLSGKLSESGGVITPKGNVDPGMRAPAPVAHPNSTPVIPPSATGGQNAK